MTLVTFQVDWFPICLRHHCIKMEQEPLALLALLCTPFETIGFYYYQRKEGNCCMLQQHYSFIVVI